MRLYLDTSAAMKLVVEEEQSGALLDAIVGLGPDDRLIASWLLHTELHGAANRSADEVPDVSVRAVLDTVSLVDLVRADLVDAPTRGAGLRSQDALHLTVALRTRCDAIVTYDEEQAAAARTAGLEVLQPA